ncbi:MAG: hypothetical protein GX627_01430 [Parcubacteria group bacterium]|jgi:hypothetical protein|nr:hypothetical protein [Parcubacteria group bacterium]
MSKNLEPGFSKIDDLLSDVEQSTGSEKLLTEIDELCGEIDDSLEHRKKEITEWSIERKRKEATDADDPFVLNLLSMDESFNVRILSACNPNTPEASLRRLAEDADDYVKMVMANNPNCTSDLLDRISETSREQEVLDAVKNHPNTSVATRHKIKNRM